MNVGGACSSHEQTETKPFTFTSTRLETTRCLCSKGILIFSFSRALTPQRCAYTTYNIHPFLSLSHSGFPHAFPVCPAGHSSLPLGPCCTPNLSWSVTFYINVCAITSPVHVYEKEFPVGADCKLTGRMIADRKPQERPIGDIASLYGVSRILPPCSS